MAHLTGKVMTISMTRRYRINSQMGMVRNTRLEVLDAWCEGWMDIDPLDNMWRQSDLHGDVDWAQNKLKISNYIPFCTEQ